MNVITPSPLRSLSRYLGLFAVGMLLLVPVAAQADTFQGPLYFTAYAGNPRVFEVNLTYDDSAHTLNLGRIGSVANLPGADGIVFTSDNQLAVAGQNFSVYKVDQSKPFPAPFTTHASPTGALHMFAAPDGNVFTSVMAGYGFPGGTSSFGSTVSGSGTRHAILGSEASFGVSTMAWTGSDNLHGFYTSSGPGGFGGFGTFVMDPITGAITTVRLLSNVAAAHGLAYDPYSGRLILMGASQIAQIDPLNPTRIEAALNLSGFTFDQGTVDGLGHIYAASNDGRMLFLDIHNSFSVAHPDFSATPFLVGNLDDVAPLVGPGANAAPEPNSMMILAVSSLGVLGYGWRRWRVSGGKGAR